MRRKMIFKAFAAVFAAFGIISGFADTSPVAGVLHVSSDGVATNLFLPSAQSLEDAFSPQMDGGASPALSDSFLWCASGSTDTVEVWKVESSGHPLDGRLVVGASLASAVVADGALSHGDELSFHRRQGSERGGFYLSGVLPASLVPSNAWFASSSSAPAMAAALVDSASGSLSIVASNAISATAALWSLASSAMPSPLPDSGWELSGLEAEAIDGLVVWEADVHESPGLVLYLVKDAAHDADGDGIPDAWEAANGLNPLRFDLDPSLVRPGLISEFAPLNPSGLSRLVDFDSLMPEIARIDTLLSFGPTRDPWNGLPAAYANYFQSRHSGFIRIPEDGAYTFYLNSDDGSRLFLDGEKIIDNDGNHIARERSATRTLLAGDHPFVLDYYENSALSELSLSWTGPSFTKELVPASAFRNILPDGGMKPSVWLLSPVDGSSFAAGLPITLSAEAVDFDGDVAEIVFFVDGAPLGMASTPGGTLDWESPSEGAHSIFARAVDDSGNVRTSAVAHVSFFPPPEFFSWGLDCDFFALTNASFSLPDLDALTSSTSFPVRVINFPATTSAWAGFPERPVNWFACRFSGWLYVRESGRHVFWLGSDDGARLVVDGAVVVDHDGEHRFTERSGEAWLSAGLHSIRIDYFDNTVDAGLRLSWSGPSFSKEVVPPDALLRVADSSDSDSDGLPDWWEIRNGLDPHSPQSTSADADGDGLSDFQEYALNTHPLNMDTDGDGMPDGWEVANGLDPRRDDSSEDPDGDGLANVGEWRAGTNPNVADTDGDGLSDGQEVLSTRSDPLSVDIFGSSSTNASAAVSAASYSSSSGTWRTEGNVVYAAERAGRLVWNLSVPASGADALAVRVEQHNQWASGSSFDLALEIDGIFAGRARVSAPFGAPADALFFIPEASPGAHEFALVWRNREPNTFLAVHDLRFVGFSAPDSDGDGAADWLAHRADASSALFAPPLESLVSPVCVEGRDAWCDTLEVMVSWPGSNGVFSVVKTAGDGFFADVPLSQDGPTAISLAGRSAVDSFPVSWISFDAFSGEWATNAFRLRAGDSIRIPPFGSADTSVALFRASGSAGPR